MSPEPKVYAVSELNRQVRNLLEARVGNIWVEGECSNVTRSTNGHFYFTLKDARSQLKAVLFQSDQAGLKTEIRTGRKLRVHGLVTAYEKAGELQLAAKRVEDAGRGDLQAAFEALKRKLHAEGLFDPAKKKAIPTLPRHIAVITSPTGAALHDILNVIQRRFPNLRVTICPVRVQGGDAARMVVGAIEYINNWDQPVDVIIAGRGGGSIEDLWVFNEETVARAIAASRIPLISAVGHEIDTTISDYVADLRAPTPSAAAELVVDRKDQFEQQLVNQADRLVRALNTRRLELTNRFTRASGSYVFREPGNLVERYRNRLGQIRGRMAASTREALRDTREELREAIQQMGRAAESELRETRQRVDGLDDAMRQRVERRTGDAAQALKQVEGRLKALSPYAVLERGFSLTRNAAGEVIRDVAGLQPGDVVETRLARGTLKAKVEETEGPDDE